MYRVFREGVSFGDISGEAVELNDAIKMAKEYSRKKHAANFVVEKVEKIWEVKPRTSKSNAIHASIHESDWDIGREEDD
jgi:hypothetical protein